MAVDTPARIAILGAGPIGLEAALYARFLGYDVEIFERGRVCEHLLRWGHRTLFTPFGGNRSRLGLAALMAQDDAWRPPADDEFLTGRELVERYYLPLAQSDLLVDSIREQTEVAAVGREWLFKEELPGSDDRAASDFHLLLRETKPDGAVRERIAAADVVIDASGTFSQHRWLGQGGIPAAGEQTLADRIEYGLPDILGRKRAHYLGRHTLVVGSGHSAATTATALARLAADPSAATRATWITRREAVNGSAGPIASEPGDPLVGRAELTNAANRLAAGECAAIQHWAGTTIGAIAAAGEGFEVELLGTHAGTLRVDRIVANVGYRPDPTIFSELQVALDPASEGPARLAEALRAAPALDFAPPGCGPESLVNPEPDFYVLGAKSYGREGRFFIAHGLAQVRALFTIIGDRPTLDLYATIPLPRST